MTNLKHKLFEQNRLRFFVSLLGVGVKTALAIYTAFLLMDFTDVAIGGSMDDLTRMLITFVIYVILYMVSDGITFYFKNRFIQKGITQYKNEAFSRVLKKHISSFQKENTSHYISALTNDVNSIEVNYLEGSFQIVFHGLLFIAALATMAYLNLILTGAVILSCLIPMIISVVFGNTITRAEQTTSSNNATFTGLVKDLLSGFTVIKSFQAEREFNENFQRDNHQLEAKKRQKRDLISFVTIFAEGGGLLVNLAIFGVGAYLAIKQELSAGTLIAFVQLANYVISPLQILPSLISNFTASKSLIEKMETSCLEEEQTTSGEAVSFDQSITLDHISFAYEEGVPILQDINLTFKKGKSYAIVGGSGSGKSTLLQLLLGYHEFEGAITMDDRDYSSIHSDQLYELYSMIQQNVFLFDDTMKHNITMFKDFDEIQFNEAIHAAGLQSLWDEKGERYHCGENGCHLSGGEKQRISIARSLLKQTPILMMDEATAALDPVTAAHVEEAILSLSDVTRLIVTHKLQESILQRYDEIIVLGNHHVIEQGSYDELYAKKGYFYSLCQIQA